MKRQYSFKTHGKVTFLFLKEPLSPGVVHEIKEKALEQFKGQHHGLILDFSSLDYIDSIILSLCISLKKAALQKEGVLKLVGLNAELKQLFQVTKLDRVLTILPTMEEAIQTCKTDLGIKEDGIEIRRANKVVVLKLPAELDILSSVDLKTEVKWLFEQGNRHFIIDLNQLTYIDSSGLEAVLYLKMKLSKEKGVFSFCNAPKMIVDLFQKTGLSPLFQEIEHPLEDVLRRVEKLTS